MKRFIYLLFICYATCFFSQGVLPVNRYNVSVPILSISPATSTFAYSLRKIRNAYSGYAIRVRNTSNNATADVSFDSNDRVGNTSNVTIVSVGSSSYTIGQTLSLSTFMGVNTVTVSIWYDQGGSGVNAIQNTSNNQPTLDLVNGPSSLPTLIFNGTNSSDSKFLVVQANINTVCPTGLGSFLLVTKPTSNIMQESFGHWDSTNWRWSFHINWSDSNVYFDSAETCCKAFRSVNNSGNINLWKQYSFVRSSTVKTIRINASAALSGNSSAAAVSSPNNGFGFGIGRTVQISPNTNSNPGYQGSLSEIIMFQRDLSSTEILPLELNQIRYWKL